jgi:transposase
VVHAGLERAGLLVVLIERRHIKAALSAMMMNTDKHGASGIAQLMRLGWFKPMHLRTLPAQEVRALLTARKLLVERLRDIDDSLRGILRGFDLKVAGSARPLPRAGSGR